jgi:hypothetical protein
MKLIGSATAIVPSLKKWSFVAGRRPRFATTASERGAVANRDRARVVFADEHCTARADMEMKMHEGTFLVTRRGDAIRELQEASGRCRRRSSGVAIAAR